MEGWVDLSYRQCTGRESNSRPLDHKSDALPLHNRVLVFVDKMVTEFARSNNFWLSCMGHDAGTLSEIHAKTTPAPNIAELKTALLSIWNDLPQEFIGKAILSFRKRLRSCVAAAGGHFEHTTFSLGLNTERAADIRHWNVCTVDEKFVQNLILYYWIFRKRLHVHLKKWTLNLKRLYLLKHTSYFNKICRICGLNPQLQTL